MKIELSTNNNDKNKISSYSNGSFTVNSQIFSNSIVISESKLLSEWAVNTFNDIATHHIEEIISYKPEIIIIGTGKSLKLLPEKFNALALSKGIGMEVMDTGAACRSYNLLVDEGRNVIAGLLLAGIS